MANDRSNENSIDDIERLTLHELIEYMLALEEIYTKYKDVLLPILDKIKIQYNQTIESSYDLESCFCSMDKLLAQILIGFEFRVYKCKKQEIFNYIRNFFYENFV